MSVQYRMVASPVGDLLVTGGQGAVAGLWMSPLDGGHRLDPSWVPDDGSLAEADRQLGEYFGGTRREFDLHLAPAGSPFQLAVWRELRRIPFGETRSYGEIARRLGRPDGSRAVGLAAGANPIAVVVPCHRVIGADGSLVGFGGGLQRKSWLLGHEQAVAGQLALL
jgi:methylated-DNA-[protein]-cysteine S-methyltransferase